MLSIVGEEMATVLFAWELGGGLGHVTILKPMIDGLLGRGHRVAVVMRDLSQVHVLFPSQEALCLPAPFRNIASGTEINTPMTFAHVLHNIGFGEPGELKTLTRAWQSLYQFISPDLILFDHSPTALLAARGNAAKKIPIGTGFCCPPDQSPLPNIRPWSQADVRQLWDDEARILGTINDLLQSWGQPSLERITQLYSQVDGTILTTFQELDHYSSRPNGRYWGSFPELAGAKPQWPDRKGKRVFAYLAAGPALQNILKVLAAADYPTLVYVSGLLPDFKKQMSTPSLRFSDEPLDLGQVGKECDLAVLHGGHGTTSAMLLAGRPVLLLPLFTEQAMTAQAVTRMGAGLYTIKEQSAGIAVAMETMLKSNNYALAAQRFAQKYANNDPAKQRVEMLDYIENILRS